MASNWPLSRLFLSPQLAYKARHPYGPSTRPRPARVDKQSGRARRQEHSFLAAAPTRHEGDTCCYMDGGWPISLGTGPSRRRVGSPRAQAHFPGTPPVCRLGKAMAAPSPRHHTFGRRCSWDRGQSLPMG